MPHSNGVKIPDDPEEWRNLGNDFFKKGQYDEAVKCYFKAIELNPQYLDAWNNLGFTYFKMGRIEEANKCKEQINKIKSSLSNIKEPQTKIKKKPVTNYIFGAVFAIVVVVLLIIAASIFGVFNGENIEYQNSKNGNSYISPTDAANTLPITTVQTVVPTTTVLTVVPTTTIHTVVPTTESFYQTADDEILYNRILADMDDIIFYMKAMVDFWDSDEYLAMMAVCREGSKTCVKAMEETAGLRTSRKFTPLKSEHVEYLNANKEYFQKYEGAAISYYYGDYLEGNSIANEASEIYDKVKMHRKNLEDIMDSL